LIQVNRPNPAFIHGWNLRLSGGRKRAHGEEQRAEAMKHAQALFCLGALIVAAGPALAKPAYVPSTVNLRAAPGTKSEIVAKIPAGSLVNMKECSEGWCEITWQEKTGFAIQTGLDMTGRVPRQQASAAAPSRTTPPGATYSAGSRYVVEDDPVYYESVPPPRVYYDTPYYRPYWGWRRYWW